MARLEARQKVKDYEKSFGYSPEIVHHIYLMAYEDEELANKMKAYAELRKQKVNTL